MAIGAAPAEFADWGARFPVPLVIVDREGESGASDIHFVHSDEEQGMQIAVDHLFRSGCRRIGCIVHGSPGTGNTDRRCAAIRRALEERSLPAADSLILCSGPGSETYVELIGKLLRQGVDALFCPGGNAGIVSLYAFSLYNRRVSDDISLIASEQTFFSRYAVPPQTTITPDYPAMASATVDIIEARLDGQTAPPSVVLPYSLLSRESVAIR